jgi:hypothetical protein
MSTADDAQRPFWRRKGFWITCVFLVPAPAWRRLLWLVERGGDGDFLISLYQRVQPSLAAHWDLALMLAGFGLVGHAIYRDKHARQLSSLPTQAGTPMPPAIQDEPLAPPESVEQLRTFYHCSLAPAVRWAIDFLDAGVCGSSAASKGAKATISQLIREFTLPSCRGDLEHLDSLMAYPATWTETRFNDAASSARALLNGNYRNLMIWVTRAGERAHRRFKPRCHGWTP